MIEAWRHTPLYFTASVQKAAPTIESVVRGGLYGAARDPVLEALGRRCPEAHPPRLGAATNTLASSA